VEDGAVGVPPSKGSLNNRGCSELPSAPPPLPPVPFCCWFISPSLL